MNHLAPNTDETNVTELEIGPDGRIYVFGASVKVLEILESLREHDDAMLKRLERSRCKQQIPIISR